MKVKSSNGTLSKKIACQPNLAIMIPPNDGPSAVPIADICRLIDFDAGGDALGLGARQVSNAAVARPPASAVAQPRQELDESLAVPVIGGVAHEAAGIAFRITGHGVVMLHQCVVVHVDDTSIGNGFIFGILRANIITIDSGCDFVLGKQLPRSAHHFGSRLVASIEQELRCEDRVTAIDVATLGASKSIQSLKLAMPRCISLIGFGDFDRMTAETA